MFKKLTLLSSILTILSIAPARAQYSFSKVYGGSSDDRPYGMFQLSNGNFVFHGYYSGNTSGYNYIGCIDKYGNLLWEKYATDPYSATSYDGFETQNGDIYITGESQINDGTPYIIKLKADGTIIFDTILIPQGGNGGTIFRSLQNDHNREITSIGVAGKFNTSYIMFHKANYDGKALLYKLSNLPAYFQLKKFFKVKGKEEYLLFSKSAVIRFDSAGNQIDSVRSIIEAYRGGDRSIYEITQNEDGTFTSLSRILSDTFKGYYLRKHNEYGLFDKFLGKLAPLDSEYVNTITATSDKGYFIAGKMFYRVDSNGTMLWSKRSYQSEAAEMVSVKQASDGGFYGCALDYDESSDHNMYVFKTTPEGDIHTGLIPINKQRLKAQVMPNPSEGFFTITGEFKQAQVTISNLLGQEVLKPQTISQGGKLDASALENGIYLLTVSEKHNTYVRKVHITR
ncbi:MAG: T9SS type A sorting domain-containing protein [Bacteroidota bacterium]